VRGNKAIAVLKRERLSISSNRREGEGEKGVTGRDGRKGAINQRGEKHRYRAFFSMGGRGRGSSRVVRSPEEEGVRKRGAVCLRRISSVRKRTLTNHSGVTWGGEGKDTAKKSRMIRKLLSRGGPCNS